MKICGVVGLGLGAAAIMLLDAGRAEAAYSYGYSYYGYNYRSVRTERVRRARTVRSKKKINKDRTDHARHEAPAKPLVGPLTIAVSIGEQRVRVFDQTSQIMESPTSTGTRAFPTLTGVFTVIQKDRHHRSNLYNDAPMPYMQRLTWSGTAMHTGVLPGYPASHGCIRLPNWFAAKLWTMTRLGTRVIVARQGVKPNEIRHAKLDLLKRKASEPPVAQGAAGKTAANEGPVTDGAGTPIPNILVDERRGAEAAASDRLIHALPGNSPNEFGPPASAAPVKALKPGPVAIFISKKEGKLFVRKGFEPVFDTPVTIDRPEAPLGTHVYTATDLQDDGVTMRWMAVSLPSEAKATSEPRTAKRHGEGRRAQRESMPHGAAPAHPAASATEALDRIALPQDALDRLAELLTPGASLIISDKGLGPQTGKGTEFIVLSR